MEEESNSSDEEFDSSVEDTEESDSWVDNTEEESDSSDDDPELQEKQDRISALPDLLIHHILSLLPSTKQAIQTGILSKRWRNQWARVPVLIFECQEYHDEYFERFIDNSLLLYDCSKIKKFHIACRFQGATNFTSKILFATRRNVEELILDFYNSGDPKDAYMLPKFIFDNSSLVELQVLSCEFQVSSMVNWPSLKALTIDCYCLKDAGSIENILSGSPSLESLEIIYLFSVNPIIVASKSLKILIFADIKITHDLEISCPNLEKLSVKLDKMTENIPSLPDKTIVNVLSGSPLLHSLELMGCEFKQLVIASESLKKLVLDRISEYCEIEISCPNLEELNWCGSDIEKCKLMNLPCLCCATLDFEIPREGCDKTMARKILMEIQHFKELKVRNSFVKIQYWMVHVYTAEAPLTSTCNQNCISFTHGKALLSIITRQMFDSGLSLF
ncbi:putative F-box/LRR-repeat protein At3g18150 isoform X2 [Euphorbia lathyris]|uniref:putative F-box/LRR-repeat protein At3g18150 isoform X2 n=1 Tax=Euphorbia lathyris TaxID=212925 RepID=UPI003313ABE1